MFRCPTAAPRGAALLLCGALGCAHAAKASPPNAADTCASPVAPTDPGAKLHDLTFSMRSSEAFEFVALEDSLQTFTLGPWECALGALAMLDELGSTEPRIARERRLACTHKTGATVQSKLRCALPEPLTTELATSYRRELTLTLSGAPDLVVACEPRSVDRLISGQSVSSSASFCLEGRALVHCAAPGGGDAATVAHD